MLPSFCQLRTPVVTCPAEGHMRRAEWGLAPRAGLFPPFPVSLGRDQDGQGQECSFQDLQGKEGRKRVEKQGSAIEFRNAAGCSVPFVEASKPRRQAAASSSKLRPRPARQAQVPQTARPEPLSSGNASSLLTPLHSRPRPKR